MENKDEEILTEWNEKKSEELKKFDKELSFNLIFNNIKFQFCILKKN